MTRYITRCPFYLYRLPDRFCFECSRECENVSAKLEKYNNVNGFIIPIIKVSCSLQRQLICSNVDYKLRSCELERLSLTQFLNLLRI